MKRDGQAGFRVGRWGWVIALAAAALLLLAVMQAPHSYAVDVGDAGDVHALQGFYFTEQLGETSYRWSEAAGRIDFPGVGGRSWRLHVRASGIRPAGPAHVQVLVNGDPLGAWDLGGEMGEYTLDVPRQSAGLWGTVRVELLTETFNAPPDTRELGIMVDAVTLEPAGWALAAPPWGLWLGLLAGIALGALLARRLRGSDGVVLGAGILLTLAAAGALWGARPLIGQVLPWLLLGELVLLALSGWLRRAAWWEWLLVALLALSAYRFTARAVGFYQTGLPPGDFSIYFQAANNIRLGEPLYDFAAAIGMPNGPVYKYPPLFAIVLAPFTVLPIRAVAAGWYGLNLALLGSVFFLIVRYLAGPRSLPPAAQALLGAGFLAFQPAWESLIRGQMDIIILFCLTLALVLADRRQGEALGGAALAFATMLKIYPGLGLAYLVWRKRWQTLAGFIAAFLALLFLSGLVVGWPTLWRYVSEVLTVQTAAVPYPENQSFDGLLGRIVIPGEATTWYTTIPFPRWALLTLYALDLLALGSTFLLLWVRPARRPEIFRLGFAVAMPLIVLLWPTAWIHYQTLLLLPYALLLGRLWRARGRPWGVSLALLLSFGLVAWGNEYNVLVPALQDGWLRLAQSYKLFGVLILWALTLWAGRRAGAPAGEEMAPA